MIPKGPSAPRLSAPPGLQGLLWATRRKKRDDAFPRGSLATRLPPPRPPQGFLSVCRKPFCFSPRAAGNLRFFSPSRVLKAPPPDAAPGLLSASRGSQTNRANSRRTLQTLRKASSPHGIQGGGDFAVYGPPCFFGRDIYVSFFSLLIVRAVLGPPSTTF